MQIEDLGLPQGRSDYFARTDFPSGGADPTGGGMINAGSPTTGGMLHVTEGGATARRAAPVRCPVLIGIVTGLGAIGYGKNLAARRRGTWNADVTPWATTARSRAADQRRDLPVREAAAGGGHHAALP
jgi:hypothetical protein